MPTSLFDPFQAGDIALGWRRITDAVHAEGGRIVVQLWHVGRVSHTSLSPGGQAPVSSTARPAEGKTCIAGGSAPCSAPRALATDEIPGVVAEYEQAALHANEAGFDGVEVHGANGCLIDQFLRDSINDRVDADGGGVKNRVRFLLEVMHAVAGAIGGGRTGLRLGAALNAPDNTTFYGGDAHGYTGYPRLATAQACRG